MTFYKKLFTAGWDDYELLDAGGGKKLERWKDIITIRPEKQAYFKSGISFKEWEKIAHWEFVSKKNKEGKWVSLKANSPENWILQYNSLSFHLQLTSFKHLGIFPEQKCNWDYISSKIKKNDSFLNLFAYTGAASCVAKSKGATVCHVDSVKQIVSWAKKNMELSELQDIRWVHEDALKFAKKEEKRNRLYDGIILDPPAWGYGTKKEHWKLENLIEELLITCRSILKKNGLLVLNTYSPSLDIKKLYLIINKVFPSSKCEFYELWMSSKSKKELYYGNLIRIIK
mgnify:CR=1 FL=1